MTLGSAHASKGFTAKIASHRTTTTKNGQAESLVSKRKQNGNMGYTAMTFRVNVPATKTTARIDQEHGK